MRLKNIVVVGGEANCKLQIGGVKRQHKAATNTETSHHLHPTYIHYLINLHVDFLSHLILFLIKTYFISYSIVIRFFVFYPYPVTLPKLYQWQFSNILSFKKNINSEIDGVKDEVLIWLARKFLDNQKKFRCRWRQKMIWNRIIVCVESWTGIIIKK